MAANLEALFDARRQLVAWASHDLRTPVAHIAAHLQLRRGPRGQSKGAPERGASSKARAVASGAGELADAVARRRLRSGHRHGLTGAERRWPGSATGPAAFRRTRSAALQTSEGGTAPGAYRRFAGRSD